MTSLSSVPMDLCWRLRSPLANIRPAPVPPGCGRKWRTFAAISHERNQTDGTGPAEEEGAWAPSAAWHVDSGTEGAELAVGHRPATSAHGHVAHDPCRRLLATGA